MLSRNALRGVLFQRPSETKLFKFFLNRFCPFRDGIGI